MVECQGVFLPEGEKHLVEWMLNNGEMVDGKGTYQIKKLRTALSHCPRFRTAIDVGGHVGLWTMQLAKKFQCVHAFEPVEAHRECFVLNTHDLTGVTLHAAALGDHEGTVCIETAPTSSGDSRVGGDGDIPLRTLDSYNIKEVDFIKLDCEGYEYFALKGGEQTIREWLPIIIVEQKPGRGQRFGLTELQAVEWLMSLGYACVAKLSGDFVMVPK